MNSERKKLSPEWIEEKRKFLKETLPSSFSGKLFRPEADFYTSYKKISKEDPQKALEEMTNKLFRFLNIEREGCVVGFYSPEKIASVSSEPAGFYTKTTDDSGKEIEVIMINAGYCYASVGVAAILAHEIMHLLLFRLDIVLEDRFENETLTDLATIETGLGILTVNGMYKFSHIWLTLIMSMFGFIYWGSEKHGFGYFKPQEYGRHFQDHLNEINLAKQEVGGYINPMSRRIVGLSPFKKYVNSSEYVEFLRKDYIKITIRKICAVVIVLSVVVYFTSR